MKAQSGQRLVVSCTVCNQMQSTTCAQEPLKFGDTDPMSARRSSPAGDLLHEGHGTRVVVARTMEQAFKELRYRTA